MTKRRMALVAACTIALAVGCASQGRSDRVERTTPFERAPLYGMVYQQDNAPCSGAFVHVDGIARAVADREGRFVISALAPGKHSVSLSREGCENLVIEIDFQDPSQVLYARLNSLDHLLVEAEAAMLRGDLGDAGDLLDRARNIDETSVIAQFLLAALDFEHRDFAKSKDRLLALLDQVSSGSEKPPPVLYLFFADLCEHHLERPDLAMNALETYLQITDDPDARSRLDHLRADHPQRQSVSPDGPSTPKKVHPPTQDDHAYPEPVRRP